MKFMKNFKRFLRIGALSTFFGYILGALFAKKSGRETRKQWSKKADQVKDKAVDLGKKIGTESQEIKEEAKKSLEEIKDAFKEDKKK
jgi:gas vesicle protein